MHADPNAGRRALSVLSGAVLVLAVLLGGSSQHAMLSTAILQLASLPLLGAGLWWQIRRQFRDTKAAASILTAGVVVEAAQLIPMPISWWGHIPGRAAVLADLVGAGVHPTYLPASLSPGETARSLMSLLPAAAVFFGTRAMDWGARRRLVQLLLALAVASAAIGFLQGVGQLGGFYSVTNAGSAVGFFANRNHFAALLYALLPFAVALAIVPAGRGSATRFRLATTYVAIAALLALGVVDSASRAGIALAMAAILGCGLLWARSSTFRRTRTWAPAMALGGSLALVAVLQMTRVGAFAQEKPGPVDEGRAVVTATTFKLAESFWPVGSGLGTFAVLYPAVEPPTTLSSEYVNHAHDDWVELWLEGSVPLAGVIGAFLLWYAAATIRVWRSDQSSMGPGLALQRAGSIGAGLLMVHSAVDYPLRTGTLVAIFGFACALLGPPTGEAVDRRGRRSALTGASGPMVLQ